MDLITSDCITNLPSCFSFYIGSLTSDTSLRTALLTAALATIAWTLKAILGAVYSAYSHWYRRTELLFALREEVRFNAENWSFVFSREFEEEIVNAMLQHHRRTRLAKRHDSFNPFTSTSSEDFIFEMLKAEFTKLPSSLVGILTQYYYTSDSLANTVNDLRSTDFKAMSIDRKIAYIRAMYAQGRKAREKCAEVDYTLTRYLEPIDFVRFLLKAIVLPLGGVALTINIILWLI